MQTPVNLFKKALAQGHPQIGLWVSLADAYSAEILAGVGYDWLLLDGEHAPNDLRSMLHQLQAIASALSALPHDAQEQRAVSHPIARVPVGDTTLIKQYLDLGVQTLLVPMVDTAAQAQQLVQATRYAPEGIRGMGSALARSSRWQAYPNYVHEANQQVCLLVQAAIHDGIARILQAGKAPGILATTDAQARQWLAAGALFVAVGADTMLLASAAQELLARFRTNDGAAPLRPAGY